MLARVRLRRVLQLVGEVERGQQLLAAPVGDAEEVPSFEALATSPCACACYGRLLTVASIVEPGLGEQLAQPLQAGEHPALDRAERLAEPLGELATG